MMETIQQLITPYINVWQQANNQELISFGISFGLLWLIAMVIEATVKKVTKEY